MVGVGGWLDGRTGPLKSPAAPQTVMASPCMFNHMDVSCLHRLTNLLHITSTDGQEPQWPVGTAMRWGSSNCVAAARSIYTICACISRCGTLTRQPLVQLYLPFCQVQSRSPFNPCSPWTPLCHTVASHYAAENNWLLKCYFSNVLDGHREYMEHEKALSFFLL